jgi:hypothetical protein
VCLESGLSVSRESFSVSRNWGLVVMEVGLGS